MCDTSRGKGEKRMFEKLLNIQLELKCQKSQYNSFGGYKFRSCEDILEAVKPHLAKYKVLLLLSDKVVQIGDRYYVEATAQLYDVESDKTISVSALAREQTDKTKMDASQITGTASSYARKYALNGLFLIDDTKDADTDEYRNQQDNVPVKTLSPATVESIDGLIKQTNTDRAKLLGFYKVDRIEDMKPEQAKHCIATLKGKLNG